MANPKDNLKLLMSSVEKAGPKVIQRWSATRKREVVLRVLRGEALDAAFCRRRLRAGLGT
jgi:hypothetical protein